MGLELDGVNGIIKNSTSDGDVTIKGNDGGSEISLLAFDVSAEGTAVFNSTVTVGSSLLINGTTPTLTIGDAGAEDTKIVFDGNAVDFVVGLDDSADEFRIGVGSGLGSDRVFEINSSGVSTFQKAVHFAGSTPTVTVGDGGAEDAKILFDGNEQNFHIGLDDSTNKLTIGLGNNLGTFPGFTMDENTAVEFPDNTVTIISSGNHDMLTLRSTDADANSGPVLVLNRDSGSPADNDACGLIKVKADDDGGNSTELVNISASFTDVSNGAEDATFLISSVIGGSQMARFTATASETVLNDDSGDIDFRVESDANTHAFFLEGSTGNIGIGTSSIDVSTQAGGSGYRVLQIENDEGGQINLDHNDAGTGSTLGQINFQRAGEVLAEIEGVTDGATDSGRVSFRTQAASGALTERLRIASAGQLSTGGETDSNVDSGGLCLNTGANDGRTLSFKNSDVAHGMTSVVQTDTYGYFQKKGAAAGGLKIGGLVETGFIAGIELDSNVTQADNAETAGAEGAIQTQSLIKSGTGTTAMGADDNIFVCRNSTTQFIVKGDGELFSNQSATVGTFDEYEDAHLVRAYDLSHGKGVIDSSFDKFVKYNKDDLQKARLIGSDKEGNATPFVNITGMSRLHNGAIWQQYEKHQRLASAFYKLAEKTIGKEEADKLLTEEEIQLLN